MLQCIIHPTASRPEVSGTTLASASLRLRCASRLQTVTAASHMVTYGYLPNSSLLQTATFAAAGTTRLATTNAYDRLNRMASVVNAYTAASSDSGNRFSSFSKLCTSSWVTSDSDPFFSVLIRLGKLGDLFLDDSDASRREFEVSSLQFDQEFQYRFRVLLPMPMPTTMH